jgi:hypothetical protein
MKNEFIPYEQALELKELGFNEECFAYYYNKELSFGARVAYGEVIESPLKQQAFRWFREEYALDSYIRPNLVYDVPKTYQYNIDDNIDGVWYNTYEEAELECLKKLIEIAKA